jgi:hypothetical protein
VDTDGDGIPDDEAVLLPPFEVNGNDPDTFDWEGYWEWLAENDLDDGTDDFWFEDYGYASGDANFAAWESQQTSEQYECFQLIGSTSYINQVKNLLLTLHSHPNNAVREELENLLLDAEIYGKEIVLRLGTGKITIGNFDNSALDMEDILKFPNSTGSGATQASIFAHELFEQLYKQLYGMNYQGAHQLAVGMENMVAGMNRGSESRIEYRNGSIDDIIRFTSPDGSLVIDQTRHTDSNGNITSVTSNPVGTP